MIGKAHTTTTQSVEVWRLHDFVTGTTERIGSKLIQGYEHHVHEHTLTDIPSLPYLDHDSAQLGLRGGTMVTC
jgi:hypothetical protein